MTILLAIRRGIAPALVTVALAGSAGASSGLPFTLVGTAPKTLTPAALSRAEKSATHGPASVGTRTLTFTRKVVRLVAVTGPDKDMLSYRIDGLRNPTLVIPRRAAIKVLFVNTDDDMFHNIRFGRAMAAYPNLMESYLKASVGTPPLPHQTEAAAHGEEITVRAPAAPGKYAYLCTVRGHAQGGMVGTILVR